MNKLELLGYGQAGMAVPEINVHIKVRKPATGEVVYDVKQPLFTMLRAINGEFSQCDDETVRTNKRFQLYNFIPRYIAFGSGTAEVDINDTKLDHELTHPDSETGEEVIYPRMKLTRTNTIENKYDAPYIKVTIKHFVPLTSLVNEDITEAGLFCEETGDNCFARIIFDKFTKDDTMVIDVTWEITIIIIETEEEPYASVDKIALRRAIKDSLAYISKNKPAYTDMCEALRICIDTYKDKAVSQLKIDQVTLDLITAMEES